MLLTVAVATVRAEVLADDAGSVGVIDRSKMKMIVLTTGKVIIGRMTPRVDGYDVLLDGGRIFVASEQIRFEAKDIEDAYVKMRETLPERTPEQHIELARWCITNQLEHRAQRELLDALHLDPNRTDAKRMLQALTAKGKVPEAGTTGSGLTEFPSTSVSTQPSRETRSLGGFSRSVAQTFVRDVQPILANKCGNAACHGNSTSSFQLQSLRRGATPMVSEQNLAAVLKQIDLSSPAQSPILAVGQGAHGGSNIPLFRGRAGGVQQKILRDWVLSVAVDSNPDLPAQMAAAEQATKVRSVSATAIRNATGEDAEDKAGPNPTDMTTTGLDSELTHDRVRSKDQMDDEILSEVQYLNRSDAFDPELFNTKYRSSTSSPLSQSGNEAAKKKP